VKRSLLAAALLLALAAAPAWASDPNAVGASCTTGTTAAPNSLAQTVICVGGVEVNAFTSGSAQIVAPVADPNGIAIGNGALIVDSVSGGGNHGLYNTGIGYQALHANTTGGSNTAIGAYAGGANTTGSNNTIIGQAVGLLTLSTGGSNILIGSSNIVDTPTSSTSNFLNIGDTIFATNTNTGTVSAPAGSVGIDTSTPQAALDVNGAARVGSTAASCSSTNAGAVQYTGGVFEGCNGTSWIPMDSGMHYISTQTASS
jgi:hypothetical protein